MNILLTNDDGIYSDPMWVLHERLAAVHRVVVVAPDRERSAVSHGITLQLPLRAHQVSLNGGRCGYAVNGTPADCVKLALLELLDDKPDVVIAGINPGVNLGVNVNYSGTVSAAREAALAGVAAVSVSTAGRGHARYAQAAEVVLRLTELISHHGLPYGTFLNVNIPDVDPDAMAGVVFSRQGVQRFEEYVERRVDPRNGVYYWQGLDRQTFEDNPEIDGTALGRAYISVTPLKCDTTDYDTLQAMRKWGTVLPVGPPADEPKPPIQNQSRKHARPKTRKRII